MLREEWEKQTELAKLKELQQINRQKEMNKNIIEENQRIRLTKEEQLKQEKEADRQMIERIVQKEQQLANYEKMMKEKEREEENEKKRRKLGLSLKVSKKLVIGDKEEFKSKSGLQTQNVKNFKSQLKVNADHVSTSAPVCEPSSYYRCENTSTIDIGIPDSERQAYTTIISFHRILSDHIFISFIL